MDEIQRIKLTYKNRKDDSKVLKHNKYTKFIQAIVSEREQVYAKIILSHFSVTGNLKFIEIGAGSGNNLPFFNLLGIPYDNIYTNELLEDRAALIRERFPRCHLHSGNALDLQYLDFFDISFQSTVFTSILDDLFKVKLAEKLFNMTKSGGIVLWYDFIYNNPSNKNVKGINRSEIRKLFPNSKDIQFYPVTLAPPIGRHLGVYYQLINFIFPFLRTHIVAIIHK